MPDMRIADFLRHDVQGYGVPGAPDIDSILQACIEAANWIDKLESRLTQVERERDAAIVDMRSMAVEDICNLCARIDEGYIPMPPHCKYADDGDCFRWRGVCEENTKED